MWLVMSTAFLKTDFLRSGFHVQCKCCCIMEMVPDGVVLATDHC